MRRREGDYRGGDEEEKEEEEEEREEKEGCGVREQEVKSLLLFFMTILPILAYGINYVQQPINHGQQELPFLLPHMLTFVSSILHYGQLNRSSRFIRPSVAARAPENTDKLDPGLKAHYLIRQTNLPARVLLSKEYCCQPELHIKI